jgi:hypothetical protein
VKRKLIVFIGNLTRHLPACSILPQPTTLLHSLERDVGYSHMDGRRKIRYLLSCVEPIGVDIIVPFPR